MLLLVAACGGESEPAESDSAVPGSASESLSTELEEDSDDEAQSTSASLHPALADFPLPAGSEIPFPADEYDNDRGTVVQFISVPQPHLDVAQFLFDELPAAGYTVIDKSGFATAMDGIDPEFGGAIYFADSKGVPGQVTLKVQGDATGLNFNVFTKETE